jgi:hypothetical protein
VPKSSEPVLDRPELRHHLIVLSGPLFLVAVDIARNEARSDLTLLDGGRSIRFVALPTKSDGPCLLAVAVRKAPRLP